MHARIENPEEELIGSCENPRSAGFGGAVGSIGAAAAEPTDRGASGGLGADGRADRDASANEALGANQRGGAEGPKALAGHP